MPEISKFFGIKIMMYYDDHNPPHFHAKYNESEMLININELTPSIIKQTMNVLLKTQSDMELENRKLNQYYKELPKESIIKINNIEEINDNEWSF